jgi:hypothetical protein
MALAQAPATGHRPVEYAHRCSGLPTVDAGNQVQVPASWVDADRSETRDELGVFGCQRQRCAMATFSPAPTAAPSMRPMLGTANRPKRYTLVSSW